jgi:1,2-diacylglycerol 3-alpha-glucosyltransferase
MIKVFIPCSGLGNINRGFESFTRECFDALSTISSLDITLFKGGGQSFEKEIHLWNLPRQSGSNAKVTRLLQQVSQYSSPNLTEQWSFFLSLLPNIHSNQPDVIYFSQPGLGLLLWHWKRWTKQRYKLLFRNGGPTKALQNLKRRWDHTQQLSPLHLQAAIHAGVPPEKQSLVPNAIHIKPQLKLLTLSEKAALRRTLNLPEERPIILSVAAINQSHKRIDYLIHELAALPQPRPYLLLLGQQDTESPKVINLAQQRLGVNHFQVRTVSHTEIANYYQVADLFVLASLREGFPRVCIEAMSYGLPCLVHDYETTRYILAEEGYFTDLTTAGNLTQLMLKVLPEMNNIEKYHLRHQRAYDHFSWDMLIPEYVKLIQKCASL